ncbi:MAG: DUF3336 domain-containing protein [Spirochaetota bacterium]
MYNQNKLDTAKNYQEWLAIAKTLDAETGKLAWREDNTSKLFHHQLLQEDLLLMQKYRSRKHGAKLLDIILESLPRHFWELNNPQLYTQALSGTKYIIDEYMQEVEKSLRYIGDNHIPGLSDKKKLNLFSEGNRIHGNTVLMLSGGASFGIYHLGVVKALWQEKLLPQIISGSSMGAIVAASICTKTDAELEVFFQNLQTVHRVALQMYAPQQIFENTSVMDPEQLLEHIQANVGGNYTFLEAYQKTGRILNVSVSATRKRQKPKVLNYLTAPNLLIEQSILASCAIPGIFAPVTLKAKDRTGRIVPYMKSEQWIDGSVHLDVPMQRIIRLHNVSRSVVSQANPHVIPFVSGDEKHNLFTFLGDMAFATLQAQVLKMLDISSELSEKLTWLSFLEKIRSMLEQEYHGDINISYPMTLESIFRIAANPSEEEFWDFIRKGEQATWPKISFIRNQLFLNQVLEDCIGKLQG